jgi:hypothetical protein
LGSTDHCRDSFAQTVQAVGGVEHENTNLDRRGRRRGTSGAQRGLSRGGFDTIAAAVAADALRTEAFDVALVDLGLPDRDGVDLCKELRARFPERPIIVVTGRDGRDGGRGTSNRSHGSTRIAGG